MSEPPKSKPGARGQDGAGDYEVGYGRPPVGSRFKPGQCGNPNGRPKKPRTLGAAIERELDRKIVVREGGREKRLTKREIAARQNVAAACRGDVRALRFIKDVLARDGIGGPDSAQPSPELAPPPLDKTDRDILAAFAALIRGGGLLTDEPAPSAACSPVPPEADRAGEAHPLASTRH